MCGRFTRKESFQHLADLLGLPIPPPLASRYNIAPSQLVTCVRSNLETGDYEFVELQWGLVPSWANDPRIGHKLINARAETVAEKPAFRHAFRQQRCLVLADGFYEWKREGKRKQPYYIRLKDHQVFAFAGLWEHWEKQEPAIESCSLITIHANTVLEPIHDRMPVVLPVHAYTSWLDPKLKNAVYLSGLLEPYEPAEMEAYPVSLMVNNPKNDQPECVLPM